MKKLTSLVGIVILVVVLTLPGCAAPEEAEPETLKIGAIHPLSGPCALWGVASWQCDQQWAEEINAHGGLLVNGVRYPVELIRGDNQADASLTRTLTERMIFEEGVKFILGPNTDVPYPAMTEVTTPEKVINFGITFDKTQYGPHKPYTTLGMWMASQTGPIMQRYFKEKFDVKRIAFIQRDEPAAKVYLESLKASAEELGIEVVATAFYVVGTTDMYPQVTKVLAGNPDIVDSPSASPEEMGLICKALRELGFEGIISQETGGDIEVTAGIAGMENTEGLYFNAGAYDPNNMSPALQEYYDKYIENWGTWHPEAPTKLYAPFVLGAAIQKAGTITDTDAVMEAFYTMQLKNPYLPGDTILRTVGQEEFGLNCQIGVPLVFAVVEKGEWKVIETYLPEPEKDINYDPPYEFQW